MILCDTVQFFSLPQILQLTEDVKHTNHELDLSTKRYSELCQESDDRIKYLEEELDGFRADHARVEQQCRLLETTSEEQRAEIVRLRLSVSELELQRESMLFQSSTHEGTISSMKSQVGGHEIPLDHMKSQVGGHETPHTSCHVPATSCVCV